MITAVDTNILLDLLIPNAPFLEGSAKALRSASEEGTLILCEVVYAELASQFGSDVEVARFLADTGIQLMPMSPEALCLASRAWNIYHERRRRGMPCPFCGHLQKFPTCTACSRTIGVRQHIISDFLIGAHASSLADRLLTRDRGFFAAYFEDLTLLP